MGYISTIYKLNEALKNKNSITVKGSVSTSNTNKSGGKSVGIWGVNKSSTKSSSSGSSSSRSGGGSTSGSSNNSTASKPPTIEEQSIAMQSDPERNAYLKSLLAKHLRGDDLGKTSSISNMEKIGEAVNEADSNKEGANNIIVMTKSDNLTHNYFHYFECWWDANNCLSGVILRMPKSETENTKYWINYRGEVCVYMGNNIANSMQETKNKDGTVNNNKYWDLKGMYPFFQGTISKIKEKPDEMEIHIDSIGKRFQAKIPKEFREAFIYNQNVRDAFQAICEFLGVYYICPPSTTETEDELEEEESAKTDGTENDVTDTLNKENKMAAKAAKAVKKRQKRTKAKKSTSTSKNSKNNKNNSTNIENIGSKNGNENNNENQEEEQEETTDNTEDEQESDLQVNGYADINFDANGSIVHGQTVIETSPDMAQTLLAITENPLLHGNYDYEENEYIIEDVGKLLRGEMFEELHNEVMNYDAITIEPKVAETTDMSTVAGGTAGATSGDSNSQNGSGGYDKTKVHATASAKPRDGWYNGQYYIGGKIYLYPSYIQSLSAGQALAKSRQTGTYTADTLTRLSRRARGLSVL